MCVCVVSSHIALLPFICIVFIYVIFLTKTNGIYWSKYFFFSFHFTQTWSRVNFKFKYLHIDATLQILLTQTPHPHLTLNKIENVLMLVPTIYHPCTAYSLILAICCAFNRKLKQFNVEYETIFMIADTSWYKSEFQIFRNRIINRRLCLKSKFSSIIVDA